MDAELSQLLSRAINSPFYRVRGAMLAHGRGVPGTKPADELESREVDRALTLLKEWLIAQAIAAYSIDKLSAEIQEFLKVCDRSNQVLWDLHQGRMEGTQAEMDQRVVEVMEQAE